jgi:hypothetical protein
MITLLFAEGHGPEGVFVVKVRFTEPADISPALTTYSAVKLLLLGLNIPLPLVLHVPDVAEPPIVPDKDTGLEEHTFWLVPALAVAAASIITCIEDTPAGQPKGVFVVKVSVTKPTDISTTLGL